MPRKRVRVPQEERQQRRRRRLVAGLVSASDSMRAARPAPRAPRPAPCTARPRPRPASALGGAAACPVLATGEHSVTRPRSRDRRVTTGKSTARDAHAGHAGRRRRGDATLLTTCASSCRSGPSRMGVDAGGGEGGGCERSADLGRWAATCSRRCPGNKVSTAVLYPPARPPARPRASASHPRAARSQEHASTHPASSVQLAVFTSATASATAAPTSQPGPFYVIHPH